VVHELKQFEYDMLCRTLYIKPEPLHEVDEANEDANDDEFGDVEWAEHLNVCNAK
jgi:hypothetical protein